MQNTKPTEREKERDRITNEMHMCVLKAAPTVEWDEGLDYPIIYQPLSEKTEVVWLNDIHNGDELVLVCVMHISIAQPPIVIHFHCLFLLLLT